MTEQPLWTPSPERAAATNLARFRAEVLSNASREDLYRWSIDHPEQFWPAVWRFCGVIAEPRGVQGSAEPWETVLEGAERMTPRTAPIEGTFVPRWFRGARLNFAENLLRFRDDREALVSWNERGRRESLSYSKLAREVCRWQSAFRAAGVAPGDRVAGYLPNIPEAVIAMLAAISLGAIWSSSSPDFGERAVLDRFGQIQPKVLITVESYLYAGKVHDLRPRLAALAAALPSTERIVLVPYLEDSLEKALEGSIEIPRALGLEEFLSSAPPRDVEPTFERLPFDHPLYVVYSSGTTGLPKAIVHGAGGSLLQHLKELVLHTDLGRGDRIFYFTTCGWMMWNWLVSSLAVGATVVLYDGAPMAPRPEALWDLAQAEGITIFGTSAKYLALCEKEGLAPSKTHDLSALRTILSTGSPLLPESFDYVYRDIREDVHLASISGGTDILSSFALGDPTAPVFRGEIQTRGLGMAVEVWRDDGTSAMGGWGELVCTHPFPSMPIGFWNDLDGARYRAAYFDHFGERGVWRHGDWARLTEHDGLMISGRSDATLNPGGVRIGTAEIYRQVERLPEIVESLAVAQEWQGDVRIVLFVRLRDGVLLDEALRDRVRREIRANASPHHVPKKIVAVRDLPRTRSGKLSELAVAAAIHGKVLGNLEALANPECLVEFRGLEELAT